MDLTCLTFPPSPPHPHTHTVIFLHGRGDTARNFAYSLGFSRNSGGRSLPELFPSFRWVFPQAGLRECVALGGAVQSQWFDIWNVGDFSDREDLQAEGLRESVNRIRKVIQAEAAGLDGCWDRIVLAGISQGAATGVHALINLDVPEMSNGIRGEHVPRKLAAFLGFSCRLPFPGRTLTATREVLGLGDVPCGDEVLRHTPVLLEHCIDDPLVLVENGRILRDALRGFGMQVTSKEYSNGGHWFNAPTGMDDVVRFLVKNVPEIPNAEQVCSSGVVDKSAMDIS